MSHQHGPSHQWCPICSALLPQHLETCPRCQHNLRPGGDSSKYSKSDFLRISGLIIGIALIPILIVLVLGIICANILQ